MSLTERLFGRPASTKLDLAPVQEKLTHSVRASTTPDIELIRARLADHLRDAGQLPLLPEQFDQGAVGLDSESQRRLALLVSLLELDPVRTAVAQLASHWPVHQIVSVVFTGLAQDTNLLTIEVLSQSEHRVEELARRFLAAIRASINGESPDDSKQRLNKLDYARLLAEAEQAKEAAKERAERLKQLQDQQEQRRGRRGKF